MAWKCYKCKKNNFRQDEITRRYINIDKNKIISYSTPIKHINRFICDECGIYSDRIEDIAYWEED